MQISQKGIDLICQFEAFESSPYICPAGKATIGYGTTVYKNGMKVAITDAPITKEKALAELLHHIEHRCYHVLLGINANQNQFDALCSFIYNIGAGAFNDSALRKLAIINPNDPNIRDQFARWNKSGGKVLAGLTKRRESEADLYFS